MNHPKPSNSRAQSLGPWVALLVVFAPGLPGSFATEPQQPTRPVDGLAADHVQNLWPGLPPGFKASEELERDTSTADSRPVADRPVIRLGHVQTPQLHVFRAEAATDSSTAVVICPGGGYSILAWDLEGLEVAKWLQRIGVTAAVVKYRVPTRNESSSWLAPAQDIQRSIELLRSGQVPGVKADRVGVLGFSAGGNASVRVATATRSYYAFDPENRERATTTSDSDSSSTPSDHVRPEFAILVYPAWLVREDEPMQLIDDVRVDETTPPMFFAHARNDRVSCMSSVTLFAELQKRDIPAALHVFADGGHGFGLRPVGLSHDQWPALCEAWMRDRGWLDP